jgi:hypothetical protein
MELHVFKGAPGEMGQQHGRAMAEAIHGNLRILVRREGRSPLPRGRPNFEAWVQSQETLIGRHWPWMLEEMHGVARGVGVDYSDILLLNLRAWQYDYYGAPPKTEACSSLAITLVDGTVACTGSLDDPPELYGGPMKFEPTTGHRFVSFPMNGTVWGNRGMNSAGLAVGISSQLLPGLVRLPNAINQDLAMRAVLQLCATVDDVRQLCRQHPFTMNIVCVDAQGGILCVQHTAAGLSELPVTQGFCALTNHVADEDHRRWLAQCGVKEFPESATTRPRRERLLTFARARNGKCTAEEVRQFIFQRNDIDPGSVHNKGSIYLTFSNPQVATSTVWIGGSGKGASAAGFEPVTV